MGLQWPVASYLAGSKFLVQLAAHSVIGSSAPGPFCVQPFTAAPQASLRASLLMSMTKGWSHKPLRSGFPSAVRGICPAADIVTSDIAITATRAAWNRGFRTVNLQEWRAVSIWLADSF